jgi:hypothetical protein
MKSVWPCVAVCSTLDSRFSRTTEPPNHEAAVRTGSGTEGELAEQGESRESWGGLR